MMWSTAFRQVEVEVEVGKDKKEGIWITSMILRPLRDLRREREKAEVNGYPPVTKGWIDVLVVA